MTKRYHSYDRPRQALLNAISKCSPPQTLKQLSLACGRNHAYLQQYVERGSPLSLPEDIRHKLAAMLDVPHESLMSEQLENELSKQPKRRKNDTITTVAFLDHPQHAGFDRQPWKMSGHLLTSMGYKNLSALALVQVGDNAIKPTANLGDFAIIDQTDKNPQHAGLFAIDGSDHIKLRFLEQPHPDADTVFVRHAPDDQGGFTMSLSSINIIGRAFWKLCLI
ncbi:hypothetical protein OAT37_00685 [Alphaproteobacteria bacterium]|nr:hypothetical protein [Alphaproteobacteria bacterium]